MLTLTTLPDLESFSGMSYLSGLLSHADVEKFDGMETLILDSWKERENRNILTIATMNDKEVAKVFNETNIQIFDGSGQTISELRARHEN